MLEILNNLKEMLMNNENDRAIKYIDEILLRNRNIDCYIDDLVNKLK